MGPNELPQVGLGNRALQGPALKGRIEVETSQAETDKVSDKPYTEVRHAG